MRGEIAHAERELAGLRNAAAVRDAITRIIAAPDSRLIRLVAPARVTTPTGVIAFSPALHRAAVEITGLAPVPGGRGYTLWWICGKRSPLKAARIVRATDKAALMVALPSVDETIEGAIMTTDSDPSITEPAGEIVLRGELTRSPVRPEIPQHKSR
jgi:hypothetical protein